MPSLRALLFALLIVPGVAVAQVVHQNLAALTRLAPDIVQARVIDLRDGIDANNVPYTEVTLEIARTLKGSAQRKLSFRQFGLRAPRPMPDGRTNVLVTPDGWPTYTVGEDVVLFLYHPAARTGLRTTVGLNQGKFVVRDGRLVNGIDNVGLLDGVALPPARRQRARAVLPAGARGPIEADAFIDLVATAVRERWFEAVP